MERLKGCSNDTRLVGSRNGKGTFNLQQTRMRTLRWAYRIVLQHLLKHANSFPSPIPVKSKWSQPASWLLSTIFCSSVDNNNSERGLGFYFVASIVQSVFHPGAEPRMFIKRSFPLLILELLSVSQRCLKWHVSLLGCGRKKPMPVLPPFSFPFSCPDGQATGFKQAGLLSSCVDVSCPGGLPHPINDFVQMRNKPLLH